MMPLHLGGLRSKLTQCVHDRVSARTTMFSLSPDIAVSSISTGPAHNLVFEHLTYDKLRKRLTDPEASDLTCQTPYLSMLRNT